MHYHTSIENVLIYGVSAILVINLVRIGSTWLIKRGGALEGTGRALSALV